MPRGRTESPYGLRERKRIAFDLFARGFKNDEVADRLNVRVGTVTGYRAEYDDQLRETLLANPSLLRNVLENTIRSLEELDQARRALWDEYEHATSGFNTTCPSCDATFVVEDVSSPATRNSILANIVKAQEQRSKTLGLFGVKQEFLLHVQSVRIVQEALINFMREELCSEDKQKLERLLTEELGAHMHAVSDMPALPVAG